MTWVASVATFETMLEKLEKNDPDEGCLSFESML